MMLSFKQIAYLGCVILISWNVTANPHPKQLEANKIIEQLYHNFNREQPLSIPERLDRLSSAFLNKPYLLTALGEGENNRFDQFPLYRTDAFDCETYVTTMLALTLANTIPCFKQILRKIRYQHGVISFTTRNHFTDLDWNLNNQRQGYIQDITETFIDENNKPVALQAIALIDKPSWYQHVTSKIIRLNHTNKKIQTQRLIELKNKGEKLAKTYSSLPYIPLTILFDQQGHANKNLLAQIPHGAIIEVIRPNWDLQKQIGTHLNVSHIGFAFWKNGTLFFRNATSEYGKVIDIDFIDYFRKTQASPTIKGINIQIILPKRPLKCA